MYSMVKLVKRQFNALIDLIVKVEEEENDFDELLPGGDGDAN